ncbi:MAG: YqaJ viral recombinase family protein [Rhodobiaceae bacterium]|jgi:putative phage-type endonuclease|nr:YqaJ viral recombinase family protein [Rhodobiaceae bacterium]
MLQGTEEWRQARAGSLGASAVHEAIAKTKSGYAASRANRMATMVIERLTGQPQDTYQNAAMLHGIETEPEARIAYEFWTNTSVEQIGLVKHPDIAGTHASPDGLVASEGLLEIKCPQPAQHLATLLGEPIPDKYLVQMLWQMRCCKRAWCDFVSYNPSFPENMRLHIQRVERDDARIKEIESEVVPFLREVDAKVAALRAKYEPDNEPLPDSARYLMAG